MTLSYFMLPTANLNTICEMWKPVEYTISILLVGTKQNKNFKVFVDWFK